MPKNLKRIYNKSPVAQSIVHEGRQISLPAGEEQLVDQVIASKFINHCFGLVEEVTSDFAAEYKDLDTGTTWIANMTGNPDMPAEVERPRWNSRERRMEMQMQINPVKAARDLAEEAEGPQVEYTAKDGTLEAKNMAARKYIIPRYRRRQLDSATANWFLTRVANATERVPGYNLSSACISRAPSNFEPDESWDLNDLRDYLRLADPDAVLGKSEQDIVTESQDYEDHDMYHRLIEDAKRMCMKRIYFRLVDTRYTLPNKKQFDERKKIKKLSKAGKAGAKATAASNAS